MKIYVCLTDKRVIKENEYNFIIFENEIEVSKELGIQMIKVWREVISMGKGGKKKGGKKGMKGMKGGAC